MICSVCRSDQHGDFDHDWGEAGLNAAMRASMGLRLREQRRQADLERKAQQHDLLVAVADAARELIAEFERTGVKPLTHGGHLYNARDRTTTALAAYDRSLAPETVE